MACWMYEGLLMFGVVFIAGYLFSTLSQTRNALTTGMRCKPLCLSFLVFTLSGSSKGQTLAMKTWHIRVVDVHGAGLTQQRALLRYALSWLWFLPLLGISWLLNLPAREGAVITLGWVAIRAILARFLIRNVSCARCLGRHPPDHLDHPGKKPKDLVRAKK